MKVTQSCPTLCDPMDSAAHGILQARILEWVAFPFSRGSSQPRDQTQVSSITGKILYQLSHQGSSSNPINRFYYFPYFTVWEIWVIESKDNLPKVTQKIAVSLGNDVSYLELYLTSCCFLMRSATKSM